MNAVIYLIICVLTGYVLLSLALPELKLVTRTTYQKKEIGLVPQLFLLPVWFVFGTILVTWTTYILACVFHATDHPLVYANGISETVFLIVSVIGILMLRKRKTADTLQKKVRFELTMSEIIFLAIAIGLALQLMFRTFFIANGKLYVGLSVFSDFSPHIGMIRSFSKGNNFAPTMYSHFTGEDIKYHFMYQFLVGNLEFMGMRLDYAMNLPSAAGLAGSFSMLYVLAMKLTGRRAVGYLSCLFFAFRSSKSFFTYLSQIPKDSGIIKTLSDNISFIGYTTNEEWGLWNLNVYCNQRHLAFTIPILLFAVILYLPYVYEGVDRITMRLDHELPNEKKSAIVSLKRCGQAVRYVFFTKESWQITNLPLAITAGVAIGAIAFWNGAVTIAVLLVLFIFAFAADHKLEFLITAVISVMMSFLQSSAFISGSAVKTKLQFGFIAENTTLFGTLDYIDRLTGILWIVLLAAFFLVKKERKHVMIAFAAPFFFAFTVSLTGDVTVNHKYIMLSLMLLSVFAAIVIDTLWQHRTAGLRIVSMILVIMLTSTGIYDYVTVIRRNNPVNSIQLELDDSLTQWVIENTTAKDTILSSNYALNQVVLGGGMLYLGWPYFGWSAGYDTNGRAVQVKAMFEADTPSKLKELIQANEIRFIIIDHDCRTSADYSVNEQNIEETFRVVYEEGTGDWKTVIYDTMQPIQ